MYYQFNQFDSFQIVDELGNAMFDVTEYINSVYNGVAEQVQENSDNIKTLKNQVESLQYTPPFKDYTSDLIRFSVEINVNKMKKVGDNTLSSEDTYSIGHDWGILRLPANYSPSGKPVPLIISCHGASGHITETEGDIDLNGYKGKLIRMGFAVMDMNGLPEEYAPRSYDEMHYGCPITLRCYIKGYEWVIRNYNIKRDGCFVEGASMGGLPSIQIAACKEIPVLAYAGFCPAMDIFKQPYCNSWDSASRTRSEIAFLFGFDGTENFKFSNSRRPNQDEINLFKKNISKVLGYYPIFRHLISGDVNTIFDVIPDSSDVENAEEQAVYDKFAVDFDVPVKIWHNWDDSVVRCRYSKYFCEMITRGGGIAYFRPFPSGGHDSWDNGQKNNVLTDINGQQFSVSASVYERYLWYQRWLVNGDNNENSKQNPPL